MQKRAFTLAEVLITLGIIGVISALTIPTLMSDTTSAQIGPKLAKAVSSFEQANEALLNANSVDTLTDGGFVSTDGGYAAALGDHFKITSTTGGYLSKDGMLYTFTITSTSPSNSGDPAYKQRVGDVTIDINGSAKPNQDGTDKFYFSWWNDGSLRPKGGTNWDGQNGDTWSSKCPKEEDVTDTTTMDYSYCAGHVFENNLKVLYK